MCFQFLRKWWSCRLDRRTSDKKSSKTKKRHTHRSNDKTVNFVSCMPLIGATTVMSDSTISTNMTTSTTLSCCNVQQGSDRVSSVSPACNHSPSTTTTTTTTSHRHARLSCSWPVPSPSGDSSSRRPSGVSTDLITITLSM